MLQAAERPLVEAYDAALLDLDGVLYVGRDAVPHAADAVAAARAAGMRTVFVTNNTSRRAAVVSAHLSELGVPAVPADVVTSGQAVTRLLRERLPAGARVLVVGTDDLADEVAEAGFAPVRTADGVAAVVQGLSPQVCYADLAEAALAIRAGALWVAGNRDSTFPGPRGLVPGNGAFVAALVTTTGQEPVVVGKPEPELHAASVERVGARRPLVVGDRLDTDVLGANRAGAASLLVLTGVTSRAELLSAPAALRPTYVSSDLRGLLVAHAGPELRGDRATCGSSGARLVDGRAEPDDDTDDALRAACALAWSTGPD